MGVNKRPLPPFTRFPSPHIKVSMVDSRLLTFYKSEYSPWRKAFRMWGIRSIFTVRSVRGEYFHSDRRTWGFFLKENVFYLGRNTRFLDRLFFVETSNDYMLFFVYKDEFYYLDYGPVGLETTSKIITLYESGMKPSDIYSLTQL